jgi:hypothetical protein
MTLVLGGPSFIPQLLNLLSCNPPARDPNKPQDSSATTDFILERPVFIAHFDKKTSLMARGVHRSWL